MLQLREITKDYTAGDSTVRALKGVSLNFRDSEFVSILGPSGCGKTTLLNIIGGLDRYTSGDLIINGRSTKEYSASDWDTYRNHSIGFVFQNYNLITHQTVLANVELALTLSGVSKSERRQRAVQALQKVGLGDQIKKKPNQMSGGQMQRVAIARALVNDPDILLADEPTGALDSETSVQIMDILKEISAEKLIIMVTHNRELAENYSGRIVSLLDGEVIGDTDPCGEEEARRVDAAGEKSISGKKKGKRSMGFFTALSLSFNNLMTKRARTLLTSFAGSIGIIGIALILALSTGVQKYINDVQRDTLSSYPITIEREQQDLGALLSAFGESRRSAMSEGEKETDQTDEVYSNSRMYDLFNAVFSAETVRNDLESFKEYLDGRMASREEGGLYDLVTSIQYNYDLPVRTYVTGPDGEYRNTEMGAMFESGDGENQGGMMDMYGTFATRFASLDLWQEALPGKDGESISELMRGQYDVVYGRWPEAANEIVLAVNENNEIADIAFYALGIVTDDEVTDIFKAVMAQEPFEVKEHSLSYEDICGISFRMIEEPELYADNDGDGVWEEIDSGLLEMKLKSARELKIVGVIRPNGDASSTALSGTFIYTRELTEDVIGSVTGSPALAEQMKPENENRDIFTGLPFEITEEIDPDDGEKAERIKEYFASLTDAEKAELYEKIASEPDEEYVGETLEAYMADYDTREKIEELIGSAYGLSEEQVSEYLEGYDDDELRKLLSERLTEMIKAQYASEAHRRIEAAVGTPSDSERLTMAAGIAERLETPEMKLGYVMNDWQQSTSMSAEAITAYLMRLTPEELDAAVLSVAEKAAVAMYAEMAGQDKEQTDAKLAAMFDEEYAGETDVKTLAGYYDSYMPSTVSGSTLDANLIKLGRVELSAPSSINIYAASFEDKDRIADIIKEYNSSASEDEQISYTDYIAMMMSGIKSIINAISYVLIAFVAISLVVSSIMIGVITYISVLERTKEIGILRSIGASKRDISMVFNAETVIVGLAAGVIGIVFSLLLCIPINMIVHRLSGITAINAFIEPVAGAVLVAISMLLTVVAGLIPSRLAANKDPVEALRTE